MNAIATKPQTYLDVEFSKLNDLTARLRTAGAKVSVRKLGTLHRVVLLEQPNLASLEQILSYIESSGQFLSNHETLKATDLSNNKLTVVTNTSDVQYNIPKNVSLDKLKTLNLEKLKKLASTHKIARRSRMNAEKLAEKLVGIVTENEFALINSCTP